MNEQPKKIMVAEDDPAISDALRIILESEGYEVLLSRDGMDALHLEKDIPNLLLLDIWLSGVDGKKVCEHLKKKKDTADLPIILVSANKDIAVIAEECGANDFLPKPFELEELLSKVKTHIK